MPFTLPELPFRKDAFDPVISEETFNFHHGKHHNGYVKKTNKLAAEAGMQHARLSEVIRNARQSGNQPLFNNAAQVWNHSFFWQCLAPQGGEPTGRLLELIAASFGSARAMLEQLQSESVGHFASGWGWLVLESGKLKVTSLHDADTPVAYDGMQPLLTIDVWEHAYYLDYRNRRADYVAAVLEKAINWDFVAQNLDGKGVDRADQVPVSDQLAQ